jgi:sugar-specific transcriptional regulator TrmB
VIDLTIKETQLSTLVQLGLTQNQAKIYLASQMTGRASVKAIAQNSKIGREDVYRVLPSLQCLGLIKKILGTPTFYEAVEPHEAMSLLISAKSQELSDLRKKALEFVANSPKSKKSLEQTDSFIMVSNIEMSIHMIAEAAKNAQKTWNFTSGYERFIIRQNMPKKLEQIKEMLKAVERGIIIRAVLDQPPKDKKKIPLSRLSFSISRALVSNPNFQYRYIDTKHVGLLGIFDDKLMFIETHQGPRVLLPQLWSNNEVLLGLGNNFFENAWKSSYNPK